MDRQNSTSPLVHANGLEDSQTSMELNMKKPLPASLVNQTTQVQPMEDKEKEANGSKCSTPDSVHKPDQTPCRLSAARIIISSLVGMYFGWFLQKSSGMALLFVTNAFTFAYRETLVWLPALPRGKLAFSKLHCIYHHIRIGMSNTEGSALKPFVCSAIYIC